MIGNKVIVGEEKYIIIRKIDREWIKNNEIKDVAMNYGGEGVIFDDKRNAYVANKIEDIEFEEIDMNNIEKI